MTIDRTLTSERPDDAPCAPTGRQVAQDRYGRSCAPPAGSRNSSRRGSPVSRATSFAAALRVCPWATSARHPLVRGSARSGRLRLRPDRQPTSRPRPRWSPRLVAGPPRRPPPGRPARPAGPARGAWSAPGTRRRAGHRRTRRPGPAGSRRSDRVPRTGRSRGRPRRCARCAPGAPRPRRGRNPSNAQRGAGMPLADECREHRRRARGWAPPARPRRPRRSTSSPPGSLTRGVPASVTSATSSPDTQPRQQLRGAAVAALGVVADEVRRDVVARPQASGEPGVLGGDHGHRPQHLDRPQRHVAKVADGRRDHVQGPGAVHGRRALSHRSSAAGVGDRGSRCPPCAGPTLAMGGIWRLNSAPATIRSTRSTIARSNPSATTSSMDRRPSTSRNRMRSMVA